ncbi:hypothetical protein C467_08735 [Halorubrum hochstenium ATCC 700873]|uniref:Uncharacterized protein n=1 Tax=Halorubrum hochstenium ATCC 700873 TaxID=1227481 RepID=M0FAH5_9EURY|nr:hypothetical protein C467_08735 [Halorubrum hochstenium ATCC 700873]
MHICGIPASALTIIVATGHLLFDDGSGALTIRLVDGLGGLGEFIGVDRLFAVLGERFHVGLYLVERLRILFGESLCEILRERGGW